MKQLRLVWSFPLETVKRAITGLESERVPFWASALTFFFAVTLRNSLEIFSDKSDFTTIAIVHFTLSYLSIALPVVLLLHLVTKTAVIDVLKVVLPCLIFVIIAPLIDLVISGGQGIDLAYLEPRRHSNVLMRFLTFGGERVGPSITPGQQIEVLLLLFCSYFYVRAKGGKRLPAFLTALVVYAVIFAHAVLPFILRGALHLIGLKYRYSDELFADFYALSVLASGTLVAYFASKTYFIIFLRDFRWLRLAHYLLMFVVGLVWRSSARPLDLTRETLFMLAFVPISVVFASLFSIVTNNLADIEIDRISNPKRPLFLPGISRQHYAATAPAFLALSLFYATMAGREFLFLMLVVIGNYFIYSMPPLRFKRVPVLSKSVISFNSLAMIVAGYLIRGWGPRDLEGNIIAVVLVGFTLASNFIDLKDVEGDGEQGVRTLPVILGPRLAKLMVSFSFVAVYLSVYTVIPDKLLLAGLVAFGLIQFLLVNRRNYNEAPVFVVHLVSIASLIGYLLIFNPSLTP